MLMDLRYWKFGYPTHIRAALEAEPHVTSQFPPEVAQESGEEDEGKKRSRCCCQTVHITTGSYFVAFFYALIIVSNLGIRVYKSEEVAWNWQLLFLVSDSSSVICLFYGTARRHPAFLQPFVVVSLLTISFCILLTVFYGTAIFYPTSYYGEQLEILLADKVQYLAEAFRITQRKVIVLAASISTFIYACTVVIHSWFMVIVVRCAQYFREQLNQKEQVEEDEENTNESQPTCLEEPIEIGPEHF